MCPACLETSQNADERTRTSTDLHPHGPEPCASTNSATSASGRERTYRTRRAALGRLVSTARPARAGGPEGAFASLGARQIAPLSSRGLGRRPLMAETRVRIPVAVLPTSREGGSSRDWRDARVDVEDCQELDREGRASGAEIARARAGE